MKVLLIQSYITTLNPDTALNEPLGLLSLASYLEDRFKQDIEINILDLFALGYEQRLKKDNLFVKGLSEKEEILKYIKKFDPAIVGINCNFTAYAQDSLEVAKLVKENFPQTYLVLGGAHATMEAENILKTHRYIDFIVRGEGEITFEALLKALTGNTDLKSIDGLSYRNNEQVINNQDRELIKDINILPLLNRKYIDMEKYKKINATSLNFTKNEPVATVMTSRGCPYNCIFCSTKIMWKRLWRPRTPESIIKEIEDLINQYQIKEIAIEDDQFIIDSKRVHQLCDLILEKKLKISLSIPPGTSIWLVDSELLIKMKKAGFYRLCFPIETGNENTLKFIRKPVDLKKVKETIKLANKIGFWTQGNFIIGFPYETKEEIEETIQYAYNSYLDFAIFFIAKPYAGSEMYEIFKKEGLLKDIVRSSHIERSDYNTKNLTAEELNNIHHRAVKNFFIRKFLFYLNPFNFFNHLWPKLHSIEDIKYAVKIFKVLFKTKIIPIFKK